MTFWQSFWFEYRFARQHRGVIYSLRAAWDYARAPLPF